MVKVQKNTVLTVFYYFCRQIAMHGQLIIDKISDF